VNYRWWLAAILLVYLVLAAGLARTLQPWCDEAWFASPGLNLVAKGQFGTSLLDETSGWGQRNLKGIRTHTYWILPLHPLLVAAWTLLFGNSLFAIRLLSTAWGIVALLAWYLFAGKLSGEPRAALFAAALLAIDFQFLWSAGEARMDMMTEALIASSFAAFLCLREKNLDCAVLAGHCLMACAALTHPISLGAFIGLLVLTVFFDGRKLGVKQLAVAASPYLAAFAAWALYIRQDPAVFWGQFYGNMTGRMARQETLLQNLWAQFSERFLYIYGLAPDTRGFSHVKILIFALYAAAVAAALLMPDFRRRREHKALLLLIAVETLVYSALDQHPQAFYLIHIMAPVIVLTALVADWLLRTRRVPAWAMASAAVAVLLVQLSVTASRIRADAYDLLYLDTANYLRQHAAPSDLIVGSSEFGFALGFDSNLVDDFRLGYLSGKHPDLIVLDKNRYQEWIPLLKPVQPDAWKFATELISKDFREVHRNAAYTTYARVPTSAK
jgi:4-amino-4-deoxy-L-arabinose transferase-like glycosyltransferase